MKYAILMQHGVDLHSCPGTLADVHDRVESMPCASSTKTQPDSRGSSPAMTKIVRDHTSKKEPRPGGGRPGEAFVSGDRCGNPDDTFRCVTQPPERCGVCAVRPVRSGRSPRCSDTAWRQMSVARRNR